MAGSLGVNLLNARLPGQDGLYGLRVNAEGRLQAVQPMSSYGTALVPGFTQVDLGGDWLSLGGVDLQINGALGLAFPELQSGDETKLLEICQFLWKQGIDGFLPTIVTSSIQKIHQALSVIQAVMQRQATQPMQETAQVVGVHLEGPFLNPAKRGAHPADYLLPLTIDHLKQVVASYRGIIKVMTLAPELDPTGATIDYLHNHLGITISLGHSLATAEQAELAFAQGASMVTHAFNAMPPLHHRQPGLLGAAILHPQVMCGLIADGEHVCPSMLNLLLKASEYDRGIFLVSDALAPLGLPDGTYPWDQREMTVCQGTARLADGTLAGTTLSLLVGAQNLVKWGICNPSQAIALVTNAPRRAIHQASLEIGQTVNLLRWHLSLTPQGQHLSWQRLITSPLAYPNN